MFRSQWSGEEFLFKKDIDDCVVDDQGKKCDEQWNSAKDVRNKFCRGAMTNPARHGQRLFSVPGKEISDDRRQWEEYDSGEMHPQFVFAAVDISSYSESHRQEIIEAQDAVVPNRPYARDLHQKSKSLAGALGSEGPYPL